MTSCSVSLPADVLMYLFCSDLLYLVKNMA